MTASDLPECDACHAAEKTPRSSEFRSGCRSCEARALAVTRVDLLGKTKALEAIGKVFKDNAEDGERMVRKWLGRMKQCPK